jgi:FSR family fosmidomycin resistance protein-like MFS transporter
MTTTTAGTTAPCPLRKDARTIGLIGLAHGTSHFFHMLLPPLFPWLIQEFGFSYSELGLLVSVFFVVSGVGQALSGFVVDRVGARPVLFLALCELCAGRRWWPGSAQGYTGLVVAAALAGLGNAPFHPVDFTILNKRVSPQRLGHGFSVHGISGNLGWATAPVFMAGIATATGSWRTACTGGAPCWRWLVLAIMVWQPRRLDDRQGAWAHQAKGAAGASRPEHPMAFLQAALGVAVLLVLLLEHLRPERHPELCQPRAAADVRPAAQRHGHGGHGLHAVRRGGHGGGRLSGGPRAAAGEDHRCLPAGVGRAAGAGGQRAGCPAWLPWPWRRWPAWARAWPARRATCSSSAPPRPAPRAACMARCTRGWTWAFALAAPVFGAMLDRGHDLGHLLTARRSRWRWAWCRRRWWGAGWRGARRRLPDGKFWPGHGASACLPQAWERWHGNAWHSCIVIIFGTVSASIAYLSIIGCNLQLSAW